MATEAEIIDKAKELVNRIYQPLGYLSCNVSGKAMWQYACDRAIEHVDEIIASSDHPGGWDTYWQQVREAIENLK